MNGRMLLMLISSCVVFNAQSASYVGRLGSLVRASTRQRETVKKYLDGYKRVYDDFGNVNHDDFSRALREGQRLGELINYYDGELKEEGIVFDPSQTRSDVVVEALPDDKIISMSDRIEAWQPRVQSEE